MKKTGNILIALVVLILFLAGCDAGESTAVDGEESVATDPVKEESVPEQEPEEQLPNYQWEVDAPENHGVNGEMLEALHTALEQSSVNAVVIVKDGVIIDEYYGEEYDETSVFRLASVSKSFTGALVGIALEEGFLDDVDVSLAAYFPQLEGTDKEAITIRHLLEHTSGIQWYEWGGNSTTFRDWRQADNWVEYVLDQPMLYAPGTTFAYTTGGPHLLAAVLAEATGSSAYEFAVEYLFAPLDMDSATWSSDEQGVTDGGNGIAMTARDAAKFGQLYLNGGRWQGRQVIPEAWVEASTTQQTTGAGNSGRYGYQWWIRDSEGYATYYAMGHAGQFIFVVPELELVTVITSRYPDNTYAPWPYFTDYILAACEAR